MTSLANTTISNDHPVALTNWLQRIQAEYREMPGLSLTRPQIQRMWGLSGEVCDALLETLLAHDILRLNRRGGYVASRS
jgi:hypothetical protein